MNYLQLNPKDNIAIAVCDLAPHESITITTTAIKLRDAVPAYHKISIKQINRGETILRYGVSIGKAINDIPAGSHVHLHNMESSYLPTRQRKGDKVQQIKVETR